MHLITGITGELGRALLPRLKVADVPVVFFVRNPAQMLQEGFTVLKADLADAGQVFAYRSCFAGRIDTILHMASARSPQPEAVYRDSILYASMILHDFAAAIGCRKFLYMSSILAAGWVPRGGQCLDERYVPDESRLTSFGKWKLRTEEALLTRARANGVKTIILRPGNIYGQPKLSFIRVVADMLVERNRILYNRLKDSIMWAPVFTQDVIDCIMRLIERDEFTNDTYFLTGPDYGPVETIARIIAREYNISLNSMSLTPSERPRYAAHKGVDAVRSLMGRPPFPDFVYTNRKVEQALGIRPTVTLEEGIPQTMRWAIDKGLLPRIGEQ